LAEITVSEWGLAESAAELVRATIDETLRRSTQLADFVERLESGTSTALINWLDYVGAPLSAVDLRAAGFVDGYQATPGIWRHPTARYPALVPDERWSVGVRVDDATTFSHKVEPGAVVEGSVRSGLRRTVVLRDGDVTLVGLERRSWRRGLDPEVLDDDESDRCDQAWRLWANHPVGLDAPQALTQLIDRATGVVGLVGADRGSSYFLEQARDTWQARNRAGATQRARQDTLGLGWGNRDHHTFRSSRASFSALLQLFATFGFARREPFYPAAQGWAAQVLEHPGTGDVIFTDVDLAPGSTEIDLDASPSPTAELGTIGLWCALHGESILEAGMHHLAAEFDFDRLRDDLAQLGIAHMPPFSELPYLRQAFTEPESWTVSRARLDELVMRGQLSADQASTIAADGGVGSHLENIAREDGFKGFNSRNISDALRSTDPRAKLH
jgi:hypothetical protein